MRGREIRGDGLVGSLLAPEEVASAPGVLLLGGSEGGLHERDARLLAAEGFTVLALPTSGHRDCRRGWSTSRWSTSPGVSTCWPSSPAPATASRSSVVPAVARPRCWSRRTIPGSVLLLSAQDDRNWPSGAYSQVAADRLAGHPHRVEHRVLPGAGHSIAGPPGAPFATTLPPGPGVTFELGGTPEINTRARAECWAATVAFLTDELAG